MGGDEGDGEGRQFRTDYRSYHTGCVTDRSERFLRQHPIQHDATFHRPAKARGPNSVMTRGPTSPE